mmetsp:Transcript_15029/g.38125  ORF Transcript_15029/g.38125 Transcript_15029/m.38125 type:complete len:288 (+) Transcript_15029:1786-2649(+)
MSLKKFISKTLSNFVNALFAFFLLSSSPFVTAAFKLLTPFHLSCGRPSRERHHHENQQQERQASHHHRLPLPHLSSQFVDHVSRGGESCFGGVDVVLQLANHVRLQLDLLADLKPHLPHALRRHSQAVQILILLLHQKHLVVICARSLVIHVRGDDARARARRCVLVAGLLRPLAQPLRLEEVVDPVVELGRGHPKRVDLFLPRLDLPLRQVELLRRREGRPHRLVQLRDLHLRALQRVLEALERSRRGVFPHEVFQLVVVEPRLDVFKARANLVLHKHVGVRCRHG